MSKKIVVALGGNAISSGNKMDYKSQLDNVNKSCELLARLIEKGYKIVITHGNGPQVGNLLLQNEISKEFVPEMPLDILTAQTQGFIGYMLEQSLSNELLKLGINKDIITISTRVEVSLEDEAFNRPTKPVGKFYTEEEKDEILKEKDWTMVEDANRGYRRVVYSPKPISILEKETIKRIIESENIVIAGGGGGIPVINKDGVYKGVEAVIDKDLTSCKLAESIDADYLMILTDVENVYLNFEEDNELKLEEVSVDELELHKNNGEFSEGSMLPKVEAAISFAKTGKVSYITSLEKSVEALENKFGTRIIYNK